MPATYEPIATTTLGSAQASVTFSSISGSYTDLVLVTNTYLSSSSQSGNITYNGDTGTNYSVTFLGGNGSSASSSRSSTRANLPLDLGYGYSSSNFGVYTVHIQNYTNTTTFKTMISRGGQAGISTNATVGLWRSTSAITSITCGTSGGNYVAGSTFTLYGIKAA